ncbi:MAG: hypothetical protein MUF10_00315 [Thermoanaerobaculaceae bacterium]|jgi:hypothetical protein|nr:hypothetical protein [Thermoanaerobaculaceae bacterium]
MTRSGVLVHRCRPGLHHLTSGHLASASNLLAGPGQSPSAPAPVRPGVSSVIAQGLDIADPLHEQGHLEGPPGHCGGEAQGSAEPELDRPLQAIRPGSIPAQPPDHAE